MIRPEVVFFCSILLVLAGTSAVSGAGCPSCGGSSLAQDPSGGTFGVITVSPGTGTHLPGLQEKAAFAPASVDDATARLDLVQGYITRNNLSWVAGRTSLSNLSSRDFQQRLGVVHRGGILGGGGAVNLDSLSPAGSGALPESFDWRDNQGNWTTPVRDQGNCGSCWAFAVTAAFESYWERLQGSPGLEPDFSEQYLVSCNLEGPGCSGGDNHAFDYFVSKAGKSGGTGTVNESDFPYRASNLACRDLSGIPRFRVPDGQQWRYVANDYTVPPVATLKQVIHDRGPVAAYVYVTDLWQFYRGGIFEDPGANPLPGQTNHAILLLGWGHDAVLNKDYWIGKNSWGTDWGENGWFRIYTDQARIGEGAAFLTMPDANPVPVITRVDPDRVSPGMQGFTLRVEGTGFVSGSTVLWNGSARETSYGSETRLSAAIPAADAERTGVALVSVENPVPGGGMSGSLPVTIAAPETPVPTTVPTTVPTSVPPTSVPTTTVPTTLPTTTIPPTVPTTVIPTTTTPVPPGGSVRADFSASPTFGPVPLTVTFTDNSSGPVSRYSWIFGDGSISSERSPVHTYRLAGTYTVSLKVSGPGGSYRKTAPSCVVAGPGVTTIPTTMVPTTSPTATLPTTVPTTPVPTSLPPTTSPAPTPTGTTVAPTPVPETTLIANFSVSPGMGDAPLTVGFTDLSTGSPSRWNWVFGDGEVSTEQNPVHVYREPGTYTVSLRVSGTGGSYRRTMSGCVTVL